jgi:predicted nuclease of predicted toxin-antitoxin system
MRFLTDAQVPPALCGWLEERGHEAVHVSEVGLIGASDAEIAARVEADGAILVTKDEDFLTLRLPDRFTLLWPRRGNATNAALRDWLEPRWEETERLLAAGERFVEVR